MVFGVTIKLVLSLAYEVELMVKVNFSITPSGIK